jgi:hypothetical protein
MKNSTRITYLVSCLFLSLLLPAKAQDNYERMKTKFFLDIGPATATMRDRTISTFAYSNMGVAVNLGLGQYNDKLQYNLFLNFIPIDPLSTDMRKGFKYDDLTSDTVNNVKGNEVDFNLWGFGSNMLFCLNSPSESKLKLWLGLNFGYNKINSRFLILNHENRSTESYLNFSPEFSAYYHFNEKHILQYSCDVSLLGYINRKLEYNLKPTYTDRTEYIPLFDESKFTSLGSFMLLGSRLGYTFKISDHFNIHAQYMLQFLRSELPLESRLVTQKYTIGLSFTF